MLKIFNSLDEIDFRQLMDVYKEENLLNGQRFYSNDPENLQILYAEQDFYGYLEVFFKLPSARYAVWVDEGRYITALRIEPFDDGLILTALETMPEVRGRGYAKKLILAVLDDLRTHGGGILYSHVEKNNTASLNVHRFCGFQVQSDRAIYLDGTVRPDAFTLAIKY